MKVAQRGGLVTVLVWALAVAFAAPPASAYPPGTTFTVTAHITNIVTGVPIGTVHYTQTNRVESVHIELENLLPNYPYWVANYPVRKCIPSNHGITSSGTPSFGIILTDASGSATFDQTVATEEENVHQTVSVSIRRGDNSHDIDGDGVTGWKDEVGLTDQPRVGLLGCDNNVVHTP